mmetsp:Transcript_7119/g.9011  ORF Transcript_7119/g.9011 Transcript_7119/m.9011 type:complete len:84 (-) Transcript_7119:234-485(-)
MLRDESMKSITLNDDEKRSLMMEEGSQAKFSWSNYSYMLRDESMKSITLNDDEKRSLMMEEGSQAKFSRSLLDSIRSFHDMQL